MSICVMFNYLYVEFCYVEFKYVEKCAGQTPCAGRTKPLRTKTSSTIILFSNVLKFEMVLSNEM